MSTPNILEFLHHLTTPLAITQVSRHTRGLGDRQRASGVLHQKLCWGMMMNHGYLFQTTFVYVNVTRVVLKRFTPQHQ
jgi:hypothetical protein